MILFAEDECYLRGGDTLGYGWGRRNERTENPIKNVKQRQTDYGVINLYNQEFIVTPDERGNGGNTVSFINYLPERYPAKKRIILGDGSSYPGGKAVQSYLKTVNPG